MPRPSRLALAKDIILSHLSQSSVRVYSEADFANLLRDKAREWKLAKSTTPLGLIYFLLDHGQLKQFELQSSYDRTITRYVWREASSLELALSIKSRGFLCHSTAVAVHNLADVDRQTIYLNAEQSAKPKRPVSLTQQGIDIAFSRHQRQSNLNYKYGDDSITIIAGKNTNQLGVETIVGPSSEMLRVTNLERTLIDIAVRPAYSGGLIRVLEAYRAARMRVGVDRLVTTLKGLNYVYPYHQAIGFLMQTAGYSEGAYSQFRELGLTYDFYLAHGIREPQYSKEWRIHFPKQLLATLPPSS